MMPKPGMPGHIRVIWLASTFPTSTLERNERRSLKLQALHTQSNISGQ
jgi:hypothetical protein